MEIPRNVKEDPDTPLSEIEYDKDIYLVQNGRLVLRHYDKIFCVTCEKLIEVVRVTQNGREVFISSQAHNKKKVCCAECNSKRKSATMSGRINGKCKNCQLLDQIPVNVTSLFFSPNLDRRSEKVEDKPSNN
jgi:formamidopyrimidine-DNA glycosylase